MLVYLNYKIVTWIVWQVLLVAERSTCNQLPWYEEIDNLLQNYRSWYEAVFSTSLPPFRWDFCAWQVDMEENVADIMYQPILHLREYFNPVPILNSYKWISGYSSLNQGWTSDSVSFGRGWVISYKWGFKVHCWYSSRKTRYTVINNSKNTVSVKAWNSKLESETRSAMNSLDPMDCSPPGSSVHGISQERTLEWITISFSRGIFPTQGSNPNLLHFWQIQVKFPESVFEAPSVILSTEAWQITHTKKLSILKQNVFIISHNFCQQSGNSLARSFWLKRSQGVSVKLSARAAPSWGVSWWADHH